MARPKKEAELPESDFIRHTPCPACGSSDARAEYSDGHAVCFSCSAYTHAPNTGGKSGKANGLQVAKGKKEWTPLEVRPISLTKRKISTRTADLFRYYEGTHAGKPCHIASYFDSDGNLCAQKIRHADKTFTVLGSMREAQLFGQHLWRTSGKRVIVTEGEIDAMSMSQVQDNKWPVVSVKNGANGAFKALQESLEWLEGFEEIVLMFDNDEAGNKAAVECSELFTPGKCKIASLPLKDASDMLQANRVQELIAAMWNAKIHRPDGIVAGTDLLQQILERKFKKSLAYPFPLIQQLTRGIRLGEIVTLTAGTGIGKSQIAREIAYHLLKQGATIGYIALEESTVRTSQGLISLYLNKPVHLEETQVTDAELTEGFNATVGSGKVFLYDHFGSLGSDNLMSKIRYLAKGCGCTHLILDHISIVVSGQSDGDERRNIDNIVTELRSFVEEAQFSLLVISHLKRIEGKKGHEDGAEVSISHLRGSGSIAHISDIVIAAERNQQDKENPNITKLRSLKNRWTGETGLCDTLEYSKVTGRITAIADYVELDSTFNDDIQF